MSVVRKGILTIVGSAVTAVTNLGISVLLARWLSPDGLGQYALLASTAELLGILGSLGLGGASVYFVNKVGMDLGSATTLVVRTSVISGSAMGMIVVLAAGFESYFGRLSVVAIAAAAILTLGKALLPAAVYLLMAAMEVLKYVVVQVMPGLVVVLLLGILALAGGLSLASAFVSAAVGQAVAVLILLIFLGSNLKWRRATSDKPWPLIKYGIIINLAYFAYAAGLDGGLFLLRLLDAEFETLGYYRVALRLSGVLVMVVMAVGPLLFSKFAAAGHDARIRDVERTSRVLWLGVWLAVILLAAVAHPAITFLFGTAFEPAVPVFQIMVVGMAARALAQPVFEMFYSVGAPAHVLAMLGLNLLVMAGMMYLLVPAHAGIGAAWAFVLANAVGLLMTYALAGLRHGIRLRNCFIVKLEDIRFIFSNLRERTAEVRTS